MIKAEDRRRGPMNKAELGNAQLGFRYIPAGNQFLYPEDKPIEFNRAEQEAFWRFHLGMRTMYAFSRMCRKPVALQLDPLKGCQLRCSYCYAETWNDDGQKAPPERLAELQKKFNFEAVQFFGGDPFYDWNYTNECLDALGKVKQIQMSTNGIGVTNERLDTCMSHATESFTFQLSVEPPSWNARKTGNGKHQNEILGDRIANLDPKHAVHIGLAIPRSGLEKWDSLDEIIEIFQKIVGNRKWTANWKLEENTDEKAPNYDQVVLPPWYTDWLKDEWFAALGDNYSNDRAQHGMVGTRAGTLASLAIPGMTPFTYWGCQAGMGALGLGPDGNLSTCHHMAAINDPRYRIETLTPRGLWALMHKEMGHQFNPICGGCVARQHCGGICFVDLNNSSCEGLRAQLELAMYVVRRYTPDNYKAIVEKTNREADSFKRNAAQYIELTSTESWARMLRGDCVVEEMADSLAGMTGYSPSVDTPLWELEPQIQDSQLPAAR